MNQYIFCSRKTNKPRINIRVCLDRCSDKDKCPELEAHRSNLKDFQPTSASRESSVTVNTANV